MNARIAAVAAGAVALSAATAGALMLGGSHTTAPAPIRTPVYDAAAPAGMVAQVIRWDRAADATGYRIWMDGRVIGLYNLDVATTLAVTCGVRHRYNVQPYNNAGMAPLPPPLYVTSPCPPAR